MTRSGMALSERSRSKYLKSGYMACKANVLILHTDCHQHYFRIKGQGRNTSNLSKWLVLPAF